VLLKASATVDSADAPDLYKRATLLKASVAIDGADDAMYAIVCCAEPFVLR